MSSVPRLNLLGTGSGLQNPQRCASSYLLEGPQGDILFDAGEPVSKTLAQRSYDWARIQGIVISHTHADHLGGLPMLVQQLHISGRTDDLALYAPFEFAQVAVQHLCLYYLFPEAMAFKLNVHTLSAGKEFHLAGFRIAPFATTHLSPYAERVQAGAHTQRCEAFAFTVDTGSTRILYSGDVGHFDDIRLAMQGARYAVVDSTHIEPADVVAWAESHPDTTVVLSHVSPKWRHEVVSDLTSRHPKASVRLAVEGETIQL